MEALHSTVFALEDRDAQDEADADKEDVGEEDDAGTSTIITALKKTRGGSYLRVFAKTVLQRRRKEIEVQKRISELIAQKDDWPDGVIDLRNADHIEGIKSTNRELDFLDGQRVAMTKTMEKEIDDFRASLHC